jgi:hypothetical protein
MAETEPTAYGVSAEPDRIGTRLVTRFAVFVVILSVAAMLLVAALFKLLERGAARRDAAAAEAAGLERRERREPPPPRLQVNAPRDFREFRSAEEERLGSYGWTDRATGMVHIPIERAMDLIARRGVAPLTASPTTVPPAAVTPAAGAKR